MIYLLDIVLSPDLAAPLWVTAIGFIANALISIAKPFIPLLHEKQEKKVLQDKLDELQTRLISCEESTAHNILSYEELKKENIEVRQTYAVLVSKLELLKSLQEDTNFLEILSKIDTNGKT